MLHRSCCSFIHFLTNVCVVSKFKSLQSRLARLREVVSELCPDKLNQVPTEEGVDIKKLGDGGLVTSDTCNAAQAVRRVIVAECIGALEMDCMHHLRNVWFGNMEKDLTKELNTLLRVSLDEIDPKLRVTSSMSAIIRAIEKEFGLCANYVKGHGALFAQWMYETHPGASLFHVARASGSRQDLCTEGSLPIFMNYEYYLEFLVLGYCPTSPHQE